MRSGAIIRKYAKIIALKTLDSHVLADVPSSTISAMAEALKIKKENWTRLDRQ
jgi:hypothetical protein